MHQPALFVALLLACPVAYAQITRCLTDDVVCLHEEALAQVNSLRRSLDVPTVASGLASVHALAVQAAEQQAATVPVQLQSVSFDDANALARQCGEFASVQASGFDFEFSADIPSPARCIDQFESDPGTRDILRDTSLEKMVIGVAFAPAQIHCVLVGFRPFSSSSPGARCPVVGDTAPIRSVVPLPTPTPLRPVNPCPGNTRECDARLALDRVNRERRVRDLAELSAGSKGILGRADRFANRYAATNEGIQDADFDVLNGSDDATKCGIFVNGASWNFLRDSALPDEQKIASCIDGLLSRPRTSLVSEDSSLFWFGANIRSDSVHCVVLTGIPFGVPTRPGAASCRESF